VEFLTILHGTMSYMRIENKTKKWKDRQHTMMLAGPVTGPLPPCLCTTPE